VTALVLAGMLQWTMAAAPPSESYAEARQVVETTGKPMLVMVGAEWCGPCQKMRTQILPRLRERGTLRSVAFAHVDADAQSRLAAELTGGGPVPQLVMYRKTPQGWFRRKLVGVQPVETVERFIQEGVELAAGAAEQPAGAPEPATEPKQPPPAPPQRGTPARAVSNP